MPKYQLEIEVNGRDNASDMLSGIHGMLGHVGQAMVGLAVGGAAAVGAGLGVAVHTAMDFESTMSGVQAVLSPTAAEMELLSDKALQLGKDTNYGAGEAASALEMLAKNGLNATQIVNGAADATIDLAAATGGDLADSADIATNAMSIFRIRAEDMADAVNGITGVTVASQFGIDDYKLALAQAGQTAVNAGVEFDDFNAAITAIAPAFASGSDAGTSFKTLLQRLVPVSGPAAKAMRELGIIAADGSNKFFDAAGNLKDMSEIAAVLQESMQGLSEQDAIDLFTTAFGTDAQRAAFALAATGADEFERLSAALNQVSAADQAATRLDNLAGDVEQLKGSLETVGIELGMAFTPLLRDLTQAATDFINTNLIGRDWAPLINGISGAIDVTSGFVDALQRLFRDGQSLFAAGGATDGWRDSLLGWAESTLTEWVAALEPWALALVDWVVTSAPDLLANLLDLRNQAVAFILTNAPALIETLRTWSFALLNWVVDAAPGMLQTFTDGTVELIGLIGEHLPGIITALGSWALALVDWVVAAAPDLLRELGGAAGQLLDALGEHLPGIIEALAVWGAALIEWVIAAAPGLFRELLVLVGDLLTWVGERVPGIAEQLATWALAFVDWVGPAAGELIVAVGGMLGDLLTWIVDNGPGLYAQLDEWTGAFIDWVEKKLAPALVDAFTSMLGKVWGEISQLWDQAWSEGSNGDALLKGLGMRPSGGSQSGGDWSVPGFASGVRNFAGGMALVGEEGPELAWLARGTNIAPAGQTASFLDGISAPMFVDGGGGSSISVGQIVVQDAGDPRATALAIRDELLRLGRNNSDIFGGYA